MVAGCIWFLKKTMYISSILFQQKYMIKSHEEWHSLVDKCKSLPVYVNFAKCWLNSLCVVTAYNINTYFEGNFKAFSGKPRKKPPVKYMCTGYRLMPSISITSMHWITNKKKKLKNKKPSNLHWQAVGVVFTLRKQEGEELWKWPKFTTSKQERLNSKLTRIFQSWL